MHIVGVTVFDVETNKIRISLKPHDSLAEGSLFIIVNLIVTESRECGVLINKREFGVSVQAMFGPPQIFGMVGL